MLKLEFLEDYKIFKKGQKINFYDNERSAYTVIGYNESGKTIFLNIMKYIFSKEENLNIDINLNCILKFKYINDKEKLEKKEFIIENGKIKFNIPLEIEEILNNLSNLLQELKDYLLAETNFTASGIRYKEDIEMIDEYSLLRKYNLYKNYFSGYLMTELRTPNVIRLNNNQILGFNTIKPSIEAIEKEEKKLETFELPNLGLNLLDIDTSAKFQDVKLGNYKEVKKLTESFEDNKTMENFIELIKDELEMYYSENKGIANTGHDKLKEKIKEINKKFNKYYPNYAENEFLYTAASHSDITVIEGGQNIQFQDKSAGYKFWFNIFINFYGLNDKNNIIILDEPAYNLHLEAQEQFVMYLELYAEKNIILWSTHSPALINTRHNINVFERKNENVEINNDFSNNIKEEKYLINTLTMLTKNTKTSLLNIKCKKVILVEGIADFIIFQKYFINKGLIDKVYILPVGGIQHFSDYIPFLLNDYNDNIYVINDKDNGKSTSTSAKNKIKKLIEPNNIVEISNQLEDLYPKYEGDIVDKRLLANEMTQESHFSYITKKIDDLNIITKFDIKK